MALKSEAFEIRRLGRKDAVLAQQLFRLFQEVFEEEPTSAGTSYLKRLLGKPDFFVYAAFCEKEIVGGLTAYELPKYYSECSEMFIYDIAVKSEFQRQGLGKMMLETLQAYCRQQGIKEMFVAANEEDAQAVAFYRTTEGIAEKVLHFTYPTARTDENVL